MTREDPLVNTGLATGTARRHWLYRAMKPTSRNEPVCETSGRGLGVRVPRDIACTPSGTVLPATGGMSVAPNDPKHLPPHRRPLALKGLGRDPVFTVRESILLSSLRYRPDPARPQQHGFIEPATEVALSTFQGALCDTRSSWRRLP